MIGLKLVASFTLLALAGCDAQIIPVAEERQEPLDGSPVTTPVADSGQPTVSSPASDGGSPDDASPGVIQYPAWIRIADTYAAAPFDVCFPLVPSSSGVADFTGAKPAIGGAGIQTGETTQYIAVPPLTNAMRIVAAGAADCSVRIGVSPDDSLGAFGATAGLYYTVHVDESGYAFDLITVDPDPDAGAPDDASPDEDSAAR